MSGGMLVATMFMGWLPLAASLSPKKVSAFAALGSGLLLGAALSVVLPEGAESSSPVTSMLTACQASVPFTIPAAAISHTSSPMPSPSASP
jgi:zinc transporter 9